MNPHIGIIIALSMAVFALSVSLCLVIQHYQVIIQDLLDRLMARDFTDYQTGTKIGKKNPLKKWVVSDAQAAHWESEREELKKKAHAQ